MGDRRHKITWSISLIAGFFFFLSVPATSQPSPQEKATIYQNLRNCWKNIGEANRTGAGDLARVNQNCAAQGAGGATTAPWQVGIKLEDAGQYHEAAVAFQNYLNSKGRPNGDGGIAGEHLGFLYANGLGVPPNVGRARELFSASQDERGRIDLALLDHHLLPQRPEQKTQALIDRVNAIIAAEQAEAERQRETAEAEAQRQHAAWRAEHPELARIEDCRASCAQLVRSCNSMRTMDMTGLFNGTFRTPNYHCEPKGQACLRSCS